ncbi:hypothetical protein [Mucilaginibacter sp.]|uniref:hypothetical protein n=1 Tax=Mucilaginibacter sp. TaxID=1882438 RepID=UPI0035BBE68A
MKKSVILSAILFSSLVYNNAKAQVSIHVGFNLPARHVYVPAPQPVEPIYNDDFDDSDDYYYLPEVEAYYSIPLHRYFYNDGGRWISAAYLPGAYRNYDWRTARRFEIRGRRPYMNHDVYRGRWGGNANRGDWNRGNNNYAGRGLDNRGAWGNQPRNNGYNQPNRNDDRGRGNWGGGQGQPQQPSQPNRNDDRGRSNWGGGQGQQAQPSNNGGGRDRGNNGGGGQFAQNPGRMGMSRPRL